LAFLTRVELIVHVVSVYCLWCWNKCKNDCCRFQKM